MVGCVKYRVLIDVNWQEHQALVTHLAVVIDGCSLKSIKQPYLALYLLLIEEMNREAVCLESGVERLGCRTEEG